MNWKFQNKATNGYHHYQFVAIYFFLFASYGVMLPYVPVFFESNGLTSVQIGILSMIPNIASFTCAPAWSFIADAYNIRNQVMSITLVGAAVTMLALLGSPAFHYSMMVTVVNSILRAPLSPLVDSVVMASLIDTSDYGKMRLWGAVGFGVFSFVGGYSTSTSSVCPSGACFEYIFYLHLVLSFCALLVVFSIWKTHSLSKKSLLFASTNSEEDEGEEDDIEMVTVGSTSHNNNRGSSSSNSNSNNTKDALSSSKSIDEALSSNANDSEATQTPVAAPNTLTILAHVFRSQPAVLVFALIIFISGMGTGVIDTFLFIHIKNIGGTGLVMGIARFITCAAEVPMFQCAGYLQRKLGIWQLVALTQLAFVMRFVYYSSLTTPWLVLPCEVLHGFTFAVTWSVACSYASLISPPEVQSTMIALLESIHWGLGGVGSVIGGYVFQHYGAVTLFQGCAVMCAGASVIAVASLLTFKAPHATPPFTIDTVPYSHTSSDDSEASFSDNTLPMESTHAGPSAVGGNKTASKGKHESRPGKGHEGEEEEDDDMESVTF